MPLPMLKISIEGNIATGKSTFLKLLQSQNENWSLFSEPIEKWTNLNKENVTASQQRGGNLLQMFYQDIPRWCATFQSYSLLSRMRIMKEIPEKNFHTSDPVSFFERSIVTDRLVFAQNCFEAGLMSELELNIYDDCFRHIQDTVKEVKLDGIVYLRAQPEICMKRMLKRARKEEGGVSLEYLQALYEKHEEWLMESSESGYSTNGVPVLVIDCSGEFASNESAQANMLQQIKDFVIKLRDLHGKDGNVERPGESKEAHSTTA